MNQSTPQSESNFPELIVFDLDNTLWTPELYQLRKLQSMNMKPVAGRDVKLFPAAASIIKSIQLSPEKWSNTKFAVASRTKSVQWAHHLLKEFGLHDFFDYIEIFPGDKKQHFANLREMSGISYQKMMFFDDSRDGRFGNCVPVSQLGVLSVHTPKGIHEEDIWSKALNNYREWSTHSTPNVIVEWDGSITNSGQFQLAKEDSNKRFDGVVKMINYERSFGFIRWGDRNTKDLFFHFSNLIDEVDSIEQGDKVSFAVKHEATQGKNAAINVKVSKDSSDDANKVEMRAFSMNLPFAALLANEYKTLETRNGTMFTPYPEGTKILLHVGQRLYPDGNKHVKVMRSGGLDDQEIEKLKKLPPGFGKGMAVAIVELGKTFETSLEQRCDPEFQRKVGAFGADSGMRATEIRRVSYLKKGVQVSGKGGIFKVNIDRNVIPDGWL